MQTVIDELAVYLRGWKGYYGFAQVKSPIQDLEKWVRRKLCPDSISCRWGCRTLWIAEQLNQPNRRGT
ncbi:MULTISPECIES: group II intron maturase-specific domain-containing protein [Marinobacter]|uniref:Group II intron maturase-specific domain-containing protein n=1 Tax=Marinobacter metalliresistant TaxID=2961995 RepID=A0ABZ2W660_9GAMM|nr:group II intron maturase-specific domain-containing protein [Marinobacter sp. Arc7-DN-1]